MSINKLLPKKKVGKGTAPTPENVKFENLAKIAPNQLDQINLKIPTEKKLEMLFYGKQRGMTLTRLLLTAFEEYKANHQ